MYTVQTTTAEVDSPGDGGEIRFGPGGELAQGQSARQTRQNQERNRA